jgi:hypothetical protein
MDERVDEFSRRRLTRGAVHLSIVTLVVPAGHRIASERAWISDRSPRREWP